VRGRPGLRGHGAPASGRGSDGAAPAGSPPRGHLRSTCSHRPRGPEGAAGLPTFRLESSSLPLSHAAAAAGSDAGAAAPSGGRELG